MTTLYQAIDADPSVGDLPDGLIVAQNPDSSVLDTELTAKGLDPTDYTSANMRRQTIDTTDTSVWDPECIPGWYKSGGSVVREVAASGVLLLQQRTEQLFSGLDFWTAQFRSGIVDGQPPENTILGLEFLWRKRGAAYIITTNSTDHTLAERTRWAENSIMGALNVTSVPQFYASANSFSGVGLADWITWVDVSTGARLNLEKHLVVDGTVPPAVDLRGTDWVFTDITA